MVCRQNVRSKPQPPNEPCKAPINLQIHSGQDTTICILQHHTGEPDHGLPRKIVKIGKSTKIQLGCQANWSQQNIYKERAGLPGKLVTTKHVQRESWAARQTGHNKTSTKRKLGCQANWSQQNIYKEKVGLPGKLVTTKHLQRESWAARQTGHNKTSTKRKLGCQANWSQQNIYKERAGLPGKLVKAKHLQRVRWSAIQTGEKKNINSDRVGSPGKLVKYHIYPARAGPPLTPLSLELAVSRTSISLTRRWHRQWWIFRRIWFVLINRVLTQQAPWSFLSLT